VRPPAAVLALVLGSCAACAVPLDAAALARIDAEFVRAAAAAGLARAVLPHGGRTDLHCDVTRESGTR
jgi:hypothetical protein